jgi:glycosyltransferase involved in cell wall biosynthesis
MKILHVIPGIAWRYGGTTVAIRSLCSALAELPNTEIELATTDADGPHGRIAENEIPKEYSVHLFRRTATEQWKYSPSLGNWLRKNAHRFDVVHVHALWSYACHAAARAAYLAGVPYISRPAGMLSDFTFAHGAWKKRLYWCWREEWTVRRASAFHATSSAEREEIRRVRDDAVVHVISNGVDDEAWTTDHRQFRDPSRRLTVLFMSRLHPKKGLVDLLLPAWAQVRVDADLLIAGGPDAHLPQYAQRVRFEIHRLGLENRVRMLGNIPPERRWQMYDSADVFVLPSHSENFGIVIAEAMARGCPLITTDKVQACEHVNAAKAGDVIPRSVFALTHALTDLLADVDRRKRYGECGRNYAQVHFQWRSIAERIHQMYGQTIAASSAICAV